MKQLAVQDLSGNKPGSFISHQEVITQWKGVSIDPGAFWEVFEI